MKLTAAAVIALCLMACQNAPPPNFEPALAPSPGEEDLGELRRVISGALGLPDVRLSANVFARSHVLVLEPAVINTPKGRIATGMMLGKPETFHLLSDGKRCVVERVSTRQRFPVAIKCRPATP